MAKISKEDLLQIIQPFLDKLTQDQSSIEGALVVTVDGHLLARAMTDDTRVKRLATMGSSLMSLGNTITGELAMGNCRNVIVENEEGYVTFMHINSKLVLVSFTRTSNGLGLLLSASRACSGSISREIQLIKSED